MIVNDAVRFLAAEIDKITRPEDRDDLVDLFTWLIRQEDDQEETIKTIVEIIENKLTEILPRIITEG